VLAVALDEVLEVADDPTDGNTKYRRSAPGCRTPRHAPHSA
jgi:hypothetical protein